jgi:hypothetical protein
VNPTAVLPSSFYFVTQATFLLTARILICITGYIILFVMKNKFVPAAACALLSLTRGAVAQGTNPDPTDKSSYNLFNPVPENLMRDLSPDRPDVTESPYTVDAGHYQLEMDFANFTYDKTAGTTPKAWDVGDFTTRLKINLWGDDGGKTAFALLPFIKFPTSTDNLGNNAVEGGVIFPLAVSLPYDFDVSLEAAASFMKNDDSGGYHEEFIASASVDHQIIGKLSGFVEFFSNFTTESHSGWAGSVDTGFEYLLKKNIQLDCDCYFGVTHAAPDFNPFAGITVRF